MLMPITSSTVMMPMLAALAIFGLTGRGHRAQVTQPDLPKELAVLRGHTNNVNSVAITADGRTVVSGSFDKTAKVWDVATGRERVTLRGHKHLLDFVAITPEGKTVASADQDGVIKLWDVVTGRERLTLIPPPRKRPHGRLDFLSLTTDGRTVAWERTSGWIELCEVGTGQKLPSLKYYEGQFWSPAGQLLAWGGPAPLAFSPDGKTVAVSTEKEELQLWEMATGKMRCAVRNVSTRDVHAVVFHPSGRFLACGDDAVKLVDVATGHVWADLNGNSDGTYAIWAVAISADGSTLAASERPDTAIRVWDVSGLWKVRLPIKGNLSDRDLEALWADLADDDAAKAYQAVWALAGACKEAAPWIRRRLPPVAVADPQLTVPLIVALDSDRFDAREKATRALERLGDAALPALRHALTTNPSMEKERRIRQLLERLDAHDRLRTLRAIEALEHATVPAARQILETLARGIPEARLTREAKASLDRLTRR
jgi:hypothetical protein